MSPRQTLLGWGTVLLACLALCASLTIDRNRSHAAQDTPESANKEKPADSGKALNPDELIPANPILYVNWGGEGTHRDAFEKTAAYAAIYESGLMESVKRIVTQLLARTGGTRGELAGALLETIGTNGFSLSISTMGDGQPLPWGVLVLHDAADLEPRLAEAIKSSLPPDSGAEFDTVDVEGRSVTVVRHPSVPVGEATWWTEGGHLIIAFGVNATQQTIAVIDGKAENVTTSRLFKASEDQDFVQNCILWFDVERLLDVVGKIEIPNSKRDAPPIPLSEWAAAFGLDDVRSYVARSGFKGKAIRGEVRFEFAEGPNGISKLVSPAPFTVEDLPPLPQTTTGLTAYAFDADEIYATLQKMLAAYRKFASENDNRNLDRALQRISEKIDIDPRTGLIEPLGNLAVCYNDSGQSASLWGLTAIIAVDDANQLRSSFNELIESLIREVPSKQLNVHRVEKHGAEIVTFQIAGGMFNPAYTITDKWLAISILPQNIETFLLREQGELPKWKPSEKVAEALATMPEEYVSLSISHPAQAVRSLYGFVPAVASFVRAALAKEMPEARFDWNVGELPPTELVTRPLFPNVSVTTIEGSTIVKQTRDSLPVPRLNVGTTAVLVALLLPAVQQAREAARRTQSMNNLKQIALALHNYHDVYQHFPSGTVEKSAKKIEDRLSWQSQILPFLEQAAVYNKLDQNSAWNSDQNRPLAELRIQAFINPSVPLDAVTDFPAPTTYVGIAGVGEKGPTLPANHPKAGIFAYDRETSIRDITDGTSNTLMTSEAAKELGPWAQGGKSTIRALTKKPYINGPDGLGGYHTGAMAVGMADGSVRFLGENIDPELMEKFATMAGGEVIDGEF